MLGRIVASVLVLVERCGLLIAGTLVTVSTIIISLIVFRQDDSLGSLVGLFFSKVDGGSIIILI